MVVHVKETAKKMYQKVCKCAGAKLLFYLLIKSTFFLFFFLCSRCILNSLISLFFLGVTGGSFV